MKLFYLKQIGGERFLTFSFTSCAKCVSLQKYTVFTQFYFLTYVHQ